MIFAVGIGMSAAPSGTGGRPRSSRSSGHTKGPAAHLGPPSFLPSIQLGGGGGAKADSFLWHKRGERARGTLGRRSRATQRAFSNWRRRRRRYVWRCNASIRHSSEGRRTSDKQLPTRRCGRDYQAVMRKVKMKFPMGSDGQEVYNPSPTLSFIVKDAHRSLGQAFLC